MTELEAKKENFLPTFCRPMAVLGVVVGVELFAIVMSIYSSSDFDGFVRELGFSSIFLQWTGLMWAAILCLMRRQFSYFNSQSVGLFAWLLLMITTLCITWVASYLSATYFPDIAPPISLLKNLLIASIVSAMMLRYLYVHHQWKLQTEAESKAQFNALQARIRPHFLFNSMNTIANLTQTNPDLAQEVIYDLSDLFRASLLNGDRTSTLQDELDILRGYIRIEEQRIGDRMAVTWDIGSLPDDVIRIPSLLLQPLIENAVYHGIQPAVEMGTISINVNYQAGFVNVVIKNSLPADSDVPKQKGNQIALENTRQRLGYFFDSQASLDIDENSERYMVTVRFPHPWHVQ